MIFCDLNKSLMIDKLPECAIVAVGSIPIKENENHEFTIFGSVVTPQNIKEALIEALGLGAVLTFRNPRNKNLLELGEMCVGYGHTWTLHVINITILFHEVPISVRNAFAFDGRFHLSWIDNQISSKKVTFTANGSLKNWKKIKKRSEDKSFKKNQRRWFRKATDMIDPLFNLGEINVS